MDEYFQVGRRNQAQESPCPVLKHMDTNAHLPVRQVKGIGTYRPRSLQLIGNLGWWQGGWRG